MTKIKRLVVVVALMFGLTATTQAVSQAPASAGVMGGCSAGIRWIGAPTNRWAVRSSCDSPGAYFQQRAKAQCNSGPWIYGGWVYAQGLASLAICPSGQAVTAYGWEAA